MARRIKSGTVLTAALSQPQLDAMLEAAAQRGARAALAEIGLQDPDAARDVREFRSLIAAFREAKSGAMRYVGKLIAIAVISLVIWLVARQHVNWQMLQ